MTGTCTKSKYVKMTKKEVKEGERKVANFLMHVEGYSSREAERIMRLPPRNGMLPWEYSHGRR